MSARMRCRLATGQGDPPVGSERIAVYHDDGRVEEVALHDYARVYALPGVYEQIVQEDLGCRSPAKLAALLGAAADGIGRRRDALRVIDLAAGNGVSGEALRAEGLEPVLGTDVVPQAREAALRDRPGVYGEYRTLDLLAAGEDELAALRALRADALCCVAPVGAGGVPTGVLAAAARALAPDALSVHMFDPAGGDADPVDALFWARALGPGTVAERLHLERYLHRFTVTGAPYELEASVWRLRSA